MALAIWLTASWNDVDLGIQLVWLFLWAFYRCGSSSAAAHSSRGGGDRANLSPRSNGGTCDVQSRSRKTGALPIGFAGSAAFDLRRDERPRRRAKPAAPSFPPPLRHSRAGWNPDTCQVERPSILAKMPCAQIRPDRRTTHGRRFTPKKAIVRPASMLALVTIPTRPGTRRRVPPTPRRSFSPTESPEGGTLTTGKTPASPDWTRPSWMI